MNIPFPKIRDLHGVPNKKNAVLLKITLTTLIKCQYHLRGARGSAVG
jgi:hypothetical protein